MDEAPSKVKMSILKEIVEGEETVTSFEMFSCKDGTQHEYINYLIDGANVTIVAKGNFQDFSGNWSGSHQLNVSGVMDSAGAYTSRTIESVNRGMSSDGYTHFEDSTLTQSPGLFTLDGYRIHGNIDGSEMGYQSAFASGQLLNDTSDDISDIAMGDGAVRVKEYFTSDEEEEPYDPDPFIDAWLGDSTLPIVSSLSDYFSDVENEELISSIISASTGLEVNLEDVSSEDFPPFSFGSSESWDCEDTGLDDAHIFYAHEMASEPIDASGWQVECAPIPYNEWINCWQIMGDYIPEAEEE